MINVITSDKLDYYKFFHMTQDLACIANEDGYFEDLNPNWEKKLGYTIEELKATPFYELIHPSDIRKTKMEIEKLSQGHLSISFENRYRKKEGDYIWLEWSCTLEPESGHWYAIARDITFVKKNTNELKSFANRLMRQNKQLAEFAYITSHNLRGPIANIMMLTDLLEREEFENEQVKCMEKIKSSAHVLNNTLNQVIEAVKIKNDTEKNKETLTFEEVLGKTLRILNSDIKKKKAEIIYDFKNAPKISYPPIYLENIFLNFLSNALKYKSPYRDPVIKINSDHLHRKIHLSVNDNGLGINMKKHGGKLFGLGKTFHRNSEAKGHGLFITRTQVEVLGGKIWAESKEGVGTTFNIVF